MSALPIFFVAATLNLSPAAPPQPGRAPVDGSSPANHASPRVTRARLSLEGTSSDAFAAALALRLPGVELVPHDQVVGVTAGLDTFVDIRATGPHRFSLTIVVADGRAFDRTIDADPTSSPDDVTRLLASNVGNLITGIEAGTVQADRHDVPMPTPPAVVAPKCPACPEPAPAPAVPTTPVEPPRRIEIGLHAQLGAILGLGAPTNTDRFAGWGGDLGLRLRSRKGIVALAEARVGGREAAFEQRLVRARVGLGIGYAWRGDHVEIETLALATVEPWTLRSGGARSNFTQDRKMRPLLGGALRFVPGYLAQPSKRVRLRVGPKVELAFSSAIGDGGRVIQLLVDDGQRLVPIGRLAGLELDLGVELVLWFAPRR